MTLICCDVWDCPTSATAGANFGSESAAAYGIPVWAHLNRLTDGSGDRLPAPKWMPMTAAESTASSGF